MTRLRKWLYKYGGVRKLHVCPLIPNQNQFIITKVSMLIAIKEKKKPNHDVVIIGWDDNYSKELFNDQSILGDGAFICMNSWGKILDIREHLCFILR